MSSKAGVLSLTILFVCTAAAPAGTGTLDLIPTDAGVAVAIRNLNQLKKKGDKFIADTGIKTFLRPSQAFEWVYQQLGLQAGIDQDSSAAIVLASPAKMGVKPGLQNLEQLLVFVVPFTDRDTIAKNFGFAKGELKPEKMATAGNTKVGKFCYARGKHLFFGNNEKAVSSVVKGKALSRDLDAGRRKSLSQADILIQFSPPAWGDDWKSVLKDLEAGFEKTAEKEEQAVIREFIQTLALVRFGVAAVRIDDGLGISLLNVFPRKGNEAARKFLASLGSGSGGSRLTALPQGRIVAAQATRADGAKTAVIAKVLFD